jgi:hypothetical protein
MKFLGLAMAAAAFIGVAATDACANVIYNYSGLDFTVFANPPWTTSDNITGTLTLTSALPTNLPSDTNETSLVSAFSFSDGVRNFTKSNTPFPDYAFLFGTDTFGDITSWYFQFVNAGGLELTSENDAGFIGDSVGINNIKYAQSAGAGQWTVPEPGSLSLLGAGLAGLAFARRRRKA